MLNERELFASFNFDLRSARKSHERNRQKQHLWHFPILSSKFIFGLRIIALQIYCDARSEYFFIQLLFELKYRYHGVKIHSTMKQPTTVK